MAASDFSHITTPRLRLIPVTKADPAEVVAGIGNYDVARWLGRVPYPYGPDDARAFIEANRELAGRVWFITDADGLVGGISIDRELGYWLARDAWGNGYATEAGDAVIDAHFADPHAGELISGHYPGNNRSAAVLKKLGFRYTGRRPVKSAALAQTVESHELRLSRADWEARRNIRIRTERLILRPLAEADWRRLQQIGGVPEVARMMLVLTVPWPESAVRHWIATGRFLGRPGYRLGVTLNDGALIGAVGFGPDRSIAYMIDRRYWGRGYATEAARALVGDIFERFPEIDEVVADHFSDNPASGSVLAKLGFEKTGTGLGASKARVERAPNVLYRLTRVRFGVEA
jgi:RimJ/RimL family protein N-acetyltransferase